MRYQYQITVTHNGLNRHRVLRGDDTAVLKYRAQLLSAEWDEAWQRRREVLGKRKAIADRRAAAQAGLEEADERTAEAQQLISDCRMILASSLAPAKPVSFAQFKRTDAFGEREPVPVYRPLPALLDPGSSEFSPKLNFIDKLIAPLRRKKEAAAQARLVEAEAKYTAAAMAANQANERIYQDIVRSHAAWSLAKATFEQERAAHNATLDTKEAAYQLGEPRAVLDYCDLVLTRSEYPDFFPKEFSLDYRKDASAVVVDYTLPDYESIPRLSEVRYQKTKETFTEKNISDAEAQRLYADLLIQACLRTVHELFTADRAGVLASVAFNGWVRGTSPATGRLESACLVSLLVNKATFLSLNLSLVAPRACLLELGGSFSAKPHQLVGVRPLVSAEDFSDEGNTSPAYEEQLTRLATESGMPGVAFLKTADLRALIGLAPESRATAQDSREIVERLNADGYCVEPDAAALGISYKARDEIAVFKFPGRMATHPGPAYLGASAFLQLIHLVAHADGVLHATEEKLIRAQLAPMLAGDPVDALRLDAWSAILQRNPSLASGNLSKIARRLDVSQREKVMHALVALAAADGLITEGEKKAIARVAAVLELPTNSVESLFPQAHADNFTEAKIIAADPSPVGERIPPHPVPVVTPSWTPPSKAVFALDTERIAAITRETSEVVQLLASVLTDESAAPVASPANSDAPSSPSIRPTETAPINVTQSRWSFDGLPEQYHAIAASLCERSLWTVTEFNALARQHHLLPNGVKESINAWSDEALGDFLIEDADPLIVHLNLLSPAT